MAVKITTRDGLVFEVGSVEEAAKFYSLLGGTAHNGLEGLSPSDQLAANPSVKLLKTNLTKLGRKAVEAVYENPEGLTTEKLAEILGVSPKRLPPMFRGIFAASKESGFTDSVLLRESYSEAGRAKSLYRVSKEYENANERIDEEEDVEGEDDEKI